MSSSRRLARSIGLSALGALAAGLVAMTAQPARAALCGPTGNTVWSKNRANAYMGSISDVGYGQDLVFNGSGTEVTAFKVGDGSEQWSREFMGETMNEPIAAPVSDPASAHPTVVVVTTVSGKVYALDAADGSTIWTRNLDRPTCAADELQGRPGIFLGAYADSAYTNIRGAETDLVILGSRMNCGSATANKVWALNLATGANVWIFNPTGAYQVGPFSEGCTLDYVNTRVYCSADKDPERVQNTLRALNAATGASVWAVDIGRLEQTAMYIDTIGKERLYAINRDGVMHSLAPATGATTWSLPITSGGALVTRPLWSESRQWTDWLFAVDTAGNLHGIKDFGGTAEKMWSTNLDGRLAASGPAIAPRTGKLYISDATGKVNQVSLLTGALDSYLTINGGHMGLDPMMMSITAGALDRGVASAGQRLTVFCAGWDSSGGEVAATGTCADDLDCPDPVDGQCLEKHCDLASGVCSFRPLNEGAECDNTFDACACNGTSAPVGANCDGTGKDNGVCKAGACTSTDFSFCPVNTARINLPCSSDGVLPSDAVVCRADDGSAVCARLEDDQKHCGRCGNRCPAGTRCRFGDCARDEDYYTVPKASDLTSLMDNEGVADVRAIAFCKTSDTQLSAHLGTASRYVGTIPLVALPNNVSNPYTAVVTVDSGGNPSARAVTSGDFEALDTPVTGLACDPAGGANALHASFGNYSTGASASGKAGVARMVPSGFVDLDQQSVSALPVTLGWPGMNVTGTAAVTVDAEGSVYGGNFEPGTATGQAEGDFQATSRSYGAIIRAANPLAYWRMNGPKVIGELQMAEFDHGGGGAHLKYEPVCSAGTCAGVNLLPPGLVMDTPDKAVSFAEVPAGGPDGWAHTVTGLVGAAPPQFAIEFWIQFNAPPAGNSHVIYSPVAGATSNNPFGGFFVRVDAANRGFQAGTAAGPTLVGGGAIVPGQKYHVVFNYQPFMGCGMGQLFVNANLVAQGALPCGVGWNGLSISDPIAAQPFEAQLDELAVYLRALTVGEVNGHEDAGNDIQGRGLAAPILLSGVYDGVIGGSQPEDFRISTMTPLTMRPIAGTHWNQCPESSNDLVLAAHHTFLEVIDPGCAEVQHPTTSPPIRAPAIALYRAPMGQCGIPWNDYQVPNAYGPERIPSNWADGKCWEDMDKDEGFVCAADALFPVRIVSMSTDPLRNDVLVTVALGDKPCDPNSVTRYDIIQLNGDDLTTGRHLGDVYQDLQAYMTTPLGLSENITDAIPQAGAINSLYAFVPLPSKPTSVKSFSMNP